MDDRNSEWGNGGGGKNAESGSNTKHEKEACAQVTSDDRRSGWLRVSSALMDEGMEEMLTLLGSRSRLRVIRSLAGGPRDVTSIATAVDLPQNLVSYNLRTMYRAGLVTMTPKRTRRIYSLSSRLRVRVGQGGIRIGATTRAGAILLLDTGPGEDDVIDRWLTLDGNQRGED